MTSFRMNTSRPNILVVGSGLVGTAIARLIQIKFNHLVRPIIVDSNPHTKNTKDFLRLSNQDIESILKDNQDNAFIFNNKMTEHDNTFATSINTLRNSALAPSSIHLLNKLIANENLRQLLWKSGRAFHGMNVWDGVTSNMQNQYANMSFPSSNGWIGPNAVIQNILMKELADDGTSVTHAAVKKIIPTTSSTGLNEGKSIVSLQYFSDSDPNSPAGQEELEVDLVIGCDGAMSHVRQMAGIPFVHTEYEQRAFVTTVKINDPTMNQALQRFIPTGPIALLPIGEGVCNVVWSTTPEHAHYLNTLSDKDLCIAINNAFTKPFGDAPIETYYHDANILDRISTFASSIVNDFSSEPPFKIPTIYDIAPNRPIKKGSFPLRQIHVKKYVKNGIILAGDAAHAVHPLAGQGVNLGFADAAQLMKAFDIAENSGMKLSSETILQQEYEKVRFYQNELHIQFFNAVKQLFAIPHESVGLVRGIGMLGINCLPMINSKIQELASNKVDVSHIPQATRNVESI